MSKRRFHNLNPNARLSTPTEFLRWRKERLIKYKDTRFTVGQAAHKQKALLHANQEELTITWIGHSTFLIQYAGVTILTDPVWAKRMAFGKRLEKPGLSLSEIPEIDVVLLSHSHYDHLDKKSLRQLKGTPVVLVPRGLGRKVSKIMKGHSIYEVPWGGQMTIGPLEFHFVPAQHWTRRTLTDTNASHWGGWVIQRASSDSQRFGSIYFAGDSGYFTGFRQIGARFNDIRYALMPIGAYDPEWFMGTQHMTPEEAIQAFIDIGAEVFIPMHYGAFSLADDTTEEALSRLLDEWQRRQLSHDRLNVLKHGETIIPS